MSWACRFQVHFLLAHGNDPAERDVRGRPAYLVATHKPVRDAFRRCTCLLYMIALARVLHWAISFGAHASKLADRHEPMQRQKIEVNRENVADGAVQSCLQIHGSTSRCMGLRSGGYSVRPNRRYGASPGSPCRERLLWSHSTAFTRKLSFVAT